MKSGAVACDADFTASGDISDGVITTGHIIIKLNGTFSAKWKVTSTDIERSAPAAERRSHQDKHAGWSGEDSWIATGHSAELPRHVALECPLRESGKKFCCHGSLLLNRGQNASPWPSWVLLKFRNVVGRCASCRLCNFHISFCVCYFFVALVYFILLGDV